MKCSGLHCPGCGHHGGNAGIGAAGLIALIFLAAIAANRRAIGHAADVAARVVEVAAAIAAGLAVTIAVTAFVFAIGRRHARRAAANAVTQVGQRAAIPASVRALAPPGRTFAGLPAPVPSGRLRLRPVTPPDGEASTATWLAVDTAAGPR